ncbi:MAG: dTDP-4-dehydrorhamnose 3,5-epimerase [Silicimonas sp.]|nr:dTDP-4-dehydrorhamnose 3,5-epimerase [Silicimonas sp.]
MNVRETGLSGLKVIEPRRHADERGFFSESWNRKSLLDAGIHLDFVQDNHSFTLNKDAIRGLHYQAPPFGQTKLVRCGRGSLFDVAVDARRGSPTYGNWFGIELSFDNGLQLLVPEGFLHGFVTREPETEIVYKVTNTFNAASDGAVRWDSCGINWGIKAPTAISEKDANAVAFDAFESPFEWNPA